MKKESLKPDLTFVIPYCAAALLELAAIFVPGFADRWRMLFPFFNATLARFTGMFTVSVGERMIIAGLVALVPLAALLVLAPVKSIRSTTLYRRTALFYGWLIGLIALIMVANCFIVYQCTPLSAAGREHTVEELAQYRDELVSLVNEMSLNMERNEKGEVAAGSDRDIAEGARAAVLAMSGRFPSIAGFQAVPKGLTLSGFMCQQDMMGYYFPFSMEANYNTLMTPMCKPFTCCHELAHTHGFIREDEANFIAYLSCVSSRDPAFVYSGYLGILYYVDNDFYRNVGSEAYSEHPVISETVRFDAAFLREDVRAAVEDSALLPTESVKKGADIFVDTTLKVNGISDGKASYGGVVALLLDERFP